jgi:hypothetical protein
MDYDNLFKTVLHRYFWEALKILAFKLYEAADKSVAPVFLEQELQKITLDLGERSNRTDLLVRVKLKNGSNELVLCHLEIQGKGGNDLTIRMYRYKQMIYLQYGEEPIGVAVITAPRPHGEKTSYTWEKFGVRVAYDYLNVPVIKLEDAVLLAEDNRIGLILYAQQYVAHMGSLRMNEEDREMYVSVFERVYKEEGRRERSAEVAKNMLNDGVSIEKIAQYTNLPREEIEILHNP